MLYDKQIKKLRQKEKELHKKAALVEQWGPRIELTGMSRRAFCDKYGFSHVVLSRQVNGEIEVTASTVKKVEAALRKEGV